MAQMKKRFPLCVLLLIATEAPGRAQPAGPEATERQQRAKVATFADHVVRVLIFSDDDQVRPQGWGLIVGRDNNKLYIATPYHVVHNQDSPATSHIEIRFQNMPDHKVRAEILDTTANSPLDGLDLAVLSVSGADGRTLGAAPVATLGPEDGGTWVWTIGRQDSWTISATHGGFIESLTATDRLSFGGLVTPRGTSGQAVASSDGIVGMVTNDTGAGETWAIAAARIISQFRIAGLPVNLLGLGVNAAPLASSSAEPVDHVPTGLPQQGASLPAPAAAISNPNKSAGPKYEINLRGSLAHQSLQIVRPPSDAISTQHAGDTFASVHVTSPTIERIMSTSEAGWGAHTLISGDGTVIVGYADNYNSSYIPMDGIHWHTGPGRYAPRVSTDGGHIRQWVCYSGLL